MRIILDIDENYASILSLTAVRADARYTRVTSACVDLSQSKYIRFDEGGKMHQAETLEAANNGD